MRLGKIGNQLAIRAIAVYQATISPDKGVLRYRLGGRICAHEPHCSAYAKECFLKYPFFTALHYTMDRISTCVPRYDKKYDPSSYRVVFFSSAPIGVPFLQAVAIDNRFDLVGVVTMPDAPVGRGMNMQENVIKQEAKKILHASLPRKKVVLLHGKDATPEDKWYPWVQEQLEHYALPLIVPALPNSSDPVLEEWLAVIDTLDIDETTCVIGHSRGGVALLRWIETRKQQAGKVVLIATNDSVAEESKHGFFGDHEYQYATLKNYCKDWTVIHSTDDPWVPFSHGQKIAQGLRAKTWFPTGYQHFGKNMNGTFTELLPFILPFQIQTPRSLRLDSKTYAPDAETFRQWVSELRPDFFVVIAYGHIMPQWVLDIPVFSAINVHGSLLPAYRGASPLQSAFLDGKSETGITIMKMDAGVDTGDIIKKLSTPLSLHRTVRDLIDWITSVGPKFLTATLRSWAKGLLIAAPQDAMQVTVCRKFEKDDGQIDPLQDDMLQVRQKRQAFALWPQLYFFWQGKRICITQLVLHDTVSRETLSGTKMISQVGTAFVLHPGLASITLVPEGKKPLTWDEFVHGYGRTAQLATGN